MLGKKVYAQVDIGEDYKLGGRAIRNVFGSFGEFFQHLLNPVFVIAGVIMLFLLIFGGFSVIIGAGSDNSGQVQEGQKAITAAVAGFVIIIASYFIVQLIEVITGVKILDPGI